jgi:hypothetical protein
MRSRRRTSPLVAAAVALLGIVALLPKRYADSSITNHRCEEVVAYSQLE